MHYLAVYHLLTVAINLLNNFFYSTNKQYSKCSITAVPHVLTVEIIGAAVEAVLVLLTLLGGRLVVTDRGGKDTRAVLHQYPHHRQVVTRRRTVKGGPVGETHGWMDGWMVEWVGGWIDEWMDVLAVGGWISGWMGLCMGGWRVYLMRDFRSRK